jgi:hypothetical protein
VQRRLLELVARIHVGDVRKQDLRDVELVGHSSHVQRRPLLLVARIHVGVVRLVMSCLLFFNAA